jgi:excisionase family DNA binding protein
LTLDLIEAAHVLRVHPKTLQAMAKAGKVPASKPGKQWVFRIEALDAYLRSLECPSIESEPSGTSTSSTTAAALDALLDLPTGARRRSTTTALPPNSGAKSSSVTPLRARSAPR